ncbi:expressed unknown protein [Seminavis robusta]|uniref:Uncharacterized protein n=1 Tax=Seminavis robusta TaxID=568900 RepID=A0A9N8DZK7_9STRA|nr:expressed unknown protein [Seminavis robusta]|eukprot:Sro403_g135600.1 n/a (594) ;mRNA; r:13109-15012
MGASKFALIVLIVAVCVPRLLCCVHGELATPDCDATNKDDEALAAVQRILDQAFEDSRSLLEGNKNQSTNRTQEQVDKLLLEAAQRYFPTQDTTGTNNPKLDKQPAKQDGNRRDSSVNSRHSFLYADRFVDDVLDIVDDPDCMTREFNVNADDYDPMEATDVLEKCRILVLRNVYRPNFILKQFKPALAQYLTALQEGEIEPSRRAIYSTDYPTKRYEIMLPIQLAWDELIRNPQVNKILRQPQILGPNHILHSLGTVVTEPGAPHQQWHEEDNYLFDTTHSWEDFGVAGHDLPPYVINLFSPLLNVTHDHGPTEFCVGTSSTTGLLSWTKKNDFRLYNEELLRQDRADKKTFDSLLEFHQRMHTSDNKGLRQLPCPPSNLRSVLLNVGDALLFDYQVLHRAGHNNILTSEDSRAQLYLAFSREWFRDFNYDTNIYDEEEKSDPEFDAFTSQTRFASDVEDEIFDFDYLEHQEGDQGDVDGETKPIERLRNILPQEPLRASAQSKRISFVVTNLDIEQETAYLSWDRGDDDNGSGNSKFEALVAPGEHHHVRARVGSRLALLRADGQVLKAWTIPFAVTQLVVSKQIVGLAEA